MESFFYKYQYTIHAMNVGVTFCAVLLSIYFANKKYRPSNIALRLCFKTQESYDENNYTREFLVLCVDNFENLPISLNDEFCFIANQILLPIDNSKGDRHVMDNLVDPYKYYIDEVRSDHWDPLKGKYKVYPMVLNEGLNTEIFIWPRDWHFELSNRINRLGFWKLFWLRVLLFFNLCPRWFIKVKLYNTYFSVNLDSDVRRYLLDLIKSDIKKK